MAKQKPAVARKGVGSEKPKRRGRVQLTFYLDPDAFKQLEELVKRRGISKTQAIRQGLSLLLLYETDRYELILRDVRGIDPDQRILLIT